jgi:hypothetical protein
MNWKEFVESNLLGCNGNLKQFAHLNRYDKHLPEFKNILEIIKKETYFLPENCINSERIYCLYNDIKINYCKVCNKNKSIFINFKRGYKAFCCHDCFIKLIHIPGIDGLSMTQRRAIKSSETMRNIIINGKNLLQIKALKSIEKNKITKSKIGEDDLTVNQRIVKKAIITKKNDIDENGLNSFQRANLKYKETVNKIGEDGLTIRQKADKKGGETRRSLDENGISIAKKASIKANKTKLNNIDNNGLNSIQRTVLKNKINNTIIGIDGLTNIQRITNSAKLKNEKIYENGISGYSKNAIKATETKKNTFNTNNISIFEESVKKGVETRKSLDENGISIAKKASIKANKTKSIIDENGLNVSQKAAQKALITKLNNIDENGLNSIQRGLLKANKTKSIIAEDGLNIKQRAAIKAKETSLKIKEDGLTGVQKRVIKIKQKMSVIGEDGLTAYQRSNRKSAKTKSIIGEDGLSISQRAAKKSVITKINDIDENGLNSFQRGELKSNKASLYIRHYNDFLFYQANNEKYFLDSINNLGLINVINNGISLKYFFDNKLRVYISDFMYNNIIFEIKSSYTYDNTGEKQKKNVYYKLRQKNNTKWKTVLQQGYRMIVIFDKFYYCECLLSDFEDINIDLTSKKQLLTVEILKSFLI